MLVRELSKRCCDAGRSSRLRLRDNHAQAMSRRGILTLAFGLTMLIFAAPASAQITREPDAFFNQQRAVRDRIWEDIERDLPATQRVDFDFGGSYSFNLFIWDDGIDSSRTLRRNDWRVWSRVAFDRGAHEIFARARLSFIDFNTGDSFDRNDDDWEGPNLERGFYQFDLRRAMKAYADQDIDYNVRVKLGRDLVELGTGLALSQTLDHVQVQTDWKDIELTGLAGRTVGSSFDFDQGRPTDRTRRAFFAGQMRYTGFEKHRPFAYVMWQEDHNHDRFNTPFQSFDYDSFYVGVGSRGELVDRLRYSTEWVYESGHGFGSQRFLRRDVIRAWAFDMELEYLLDHPTQPRISLEYMFGSGDEDRLARPESTIGGNRFDFEDRGFVGFGWRDTGLAFAPRLTNMHIWRTGASFFPFPDDRYLKRLELGTNWFLYWKNRRSAAVSDPTANVRSGYLGWEMDYFVNWAIAHDLTWTARLGAFFPGKSFDDQTSRTFFLTGLTWSF